jgi:hypothetical protein
VNEKGGMTYGLDMVIAGDMSSYDASYYVFGHEK